MYEVVLAAETPLGRIRNCLNELSHKSLMCTLDVEDMRLIIDPTWCNQDDIKGSVISAIGVEYIKEFKDSV